jgi:hypothetical protein
MNEQPQKILSNPEKVINKEDIIRHSFLKAGMILLRCQRKNIQPKDMLAKVFSDSGRTDPLALKLIKIISDMPEYNLDIRTDFNSAREYITNIFTIIIEENPEGQVINDNESKSKWIDTGFFSYEVGESDDILLHIPSTTESPKLSQIKKSLSKIATFLRENPDIIEVRGSSLLLEHPVFIKLGFTIDFDSDDGFNPNFKMSREEFLELWGK